MRRTLALVGVTLASLAMAATPAWADQADCNAAQAKRHEVEDAIREAQAEDPNSERVGELMADLEEARVAEISACSNLAEEGGNDTEPETPPTSEPETPPTSEPETPPTSEPETPPTSEPETPPTSEPETPPTTDPAETTDPEPEPEPVFFRNCFEVFRKGSYPLFRGEPGYRPGLDRDDDGRACEREDFRRDRDRDDDDDDDRDEARDGEDGRDGRDGRDGVDGKDGVTTTVFVPTSEASNSGNVPLPVGGVATGVGPA